VRRLREYRKTLWFLMLQITPALLLADGFSNFGTSGIGIATQNSISTRVNDVFSVYVNPALGAEVSGVQWGVGISRSQSDFRSIDNVLRESTTYGASSNQYGSFDPNSTSTWFNMGISLGANDWGLTAMMSSPLDKVVSMNSVEPATPQYAYQSDSPDQYNLLLTVSRKFDERFSFGVSADLYLVYASTVDSRFPVSPDSTNIQQTTVARPALAPHVGANAQWNSHFSTSLVFRAEKRGEVKLDVNNRVAPANIPVDFRGTQTTFFRPQTVEAGVGIRLANHSLDLLVEHERWSRFESPWVLVEFETPANTYTQYRYETRYKDVLNYKASYTLNIDDKNAAFFGYGFHPSFVETDLTGPVNVVDTDKHIASVGARSALGQLTSYLEGAQISFGYQLQILNNRRIDKANPNYIGYPGFDVGGLNHIFSLAVTSALEGKSL